MLNGTSGNTVYNATVQGYIAVPQGHGGGMKQVFVGRTNNQGVLKVTNLTMLRGIANEWVHKQGKALSKWSSPNILLFITKSYSNGSVYFSQSSVPLTSIEILNGDSANVYAKLNTGMKPTLHISPNKNLSSTKTAFAKNNQAIPAQGLSLPIVKSDGAYYEWVESNNYTYYPSGGPGNIPVAWANAANSAYDWVGASMFTSTSDNLKIGFAISSSSGWGFQSGGTVWNVKNAQGNGDSTGTTVSGTSYLNMYGQVEGAWYQLWYVSSYGDYAYNDWQYDTAIVNVQNSPSSTAIGTYSITSTAPSGFVHNVEQSYNYNQIGSVFSGTGSISNTQYPVDKALSSTSLVNSYSSSDTTWINAALPVGALLLLVPGIDIPDAIALGIVATMSYSTSSSSDFLTWANAGASSGQTGTLYAMIGTQSYTLSNGNTGTIPLMYVSTTSYVSSSGGGSSGGGGCVLYGTNITLANGVDIPVQNLKTGMKTLSYNPSNSSLVSTAVSKVTETNVSSVIEINHKIFISGMGDQPVYVKLRNGTTEFTVLGEVNYTMQIFNPVKDKWTNVSSIILKQGNFSVYDVVTARQFDTAGHTKVINDYIANDVLLDLKLA